MAHPGETIENPLTGERITFLKTTEDTGGKLLQFEYAAPPHAEGPPEHIHPRQEERFEVVSGTLVARARGCERTLGEGQSIGIATGTPHTFRNPGGEEVRFLVEFRPALGIEPFFETVWGLVRDGKATALGVPKNPLQLAVLAATYRDEVYLARPPIPMQKALFAVAAGTLTPLGKLLGYRARYPEYSGPEQTSCWDGEAKRSVTVAGSMAVWAVILGLTLLRRRWRRRRLSG
jgi:mannose-6-phosphate isomerase-like protein (cupin superfamily)